MEDYTDSQKHKLRKPHCFILPDRHVKRCLSAVFLTQSEKRVRLSSGYPEGTGGLFEWDTFDTAECGSRRSGLMCFLQSY